MFQATIGQVLQFLSELFNTGVGVSALNSARSALSAILQPIDGKQVGEHPLVTRLLKGVKAKRPSLPRYKCIWDPNLVLKHLQDSDNNKIKDLTLNLTMLLALVTGQRAQTLHALKLSDMEVNEGSVTFTIACPLKTREPGATIHLMSFECQKLCVVTLLHQYIARTKSVRQDEGLLLSFVRPFRAVTCDTVRRWLLSVMETSGVNTTIFKAHSTRAAATSAAQRHKVPIASIMKAGMWRSENTFVRFYSRPVVKEDNSFAEGVLGGCL